jgi:Protein of unknown function (DUF2971)
MIVYKYLSVDVGMKVLTNSSIRFTQPAALNDPFEALWCLDEDSINETVNIVRVGLEKDGETITPDRELEIKNGVRELIEKLPYDFSEVIGFLSLSKENNISLMWSHYADNHKGLAIGFDRDIFHSTYPLCDVEYSPSRPTYKQKTDDAEKQFLDLLLTKSVHWHYEQEVRSVVRLEKSEDSRELRNEKYLCHLFKFPQESIKEIIFGARTTSTEREEIQQLLHENHSQVIVYEAKPNYSSFDLEILPVTTSK